MHVRIWRTAVPAHPVHGRPNAPRATGRLALVTALALIVVATAALLLHPWQTGPANVADRTARAQANLIADSVLKAQLRPADLQSPVSAARRRTLDRLFRRQILVDGIAVASVRGADGRVTYSTDHDLIGRSAPGAAASLPTTSMSRSH